MTPDEKAIRDLVSQWMAASKAGDLTTIQSLMTDDVLFLVAGQKPFGREAFSTRTKEMKNTTIEGKSDIQEVVVSGDWAWMRNRLEVTVTMPDGTQSRRAGPTLTIFRRRADGRWAIARDANLLSPMTDG